MISMDRAASYADDIYAWSQEQALALRRLAGTRRDLPNELDLEHVAEEIEDVGRSELRTVASFIELLLRHLLKLASVPSAPPARHWIGEVKVQRENIRTELRPSMIQHIDLDVLWRTALVRADAALDGHGDSLLSDLPSRCPLRLDDLAAPDFQLDTVLERIRASANPG